MSDEHPTYPNPTITEAVCDIHFRLKEWKPSLPGELFKHIQDEFPEMEPIIELGVQLEFGPFGTGTKILPQTQKVRYKHGSRPLILQLAENNLSVSILPPYKGWRLMKDDVLSAWQKAEEVLQPITIFRIGLRYINRIEKDTELARTADWLVANDFIPKSILQSEKGFLLRLQTHLNAENLVIVTLGDTQAVSETEFGNIIFDIDRIVEREIQPQADILNQEMDRLHSDVWHIFESARGVKLSLLLNKRTR